MQDSVFDRKPSISQCKTCGSNYQMYGDGWDKECSQCADIRWIREEQDSIEQDNSW